MRRCNVQVAVRLRDGSHQHGHLPTARATAHIDGNAVVVTSDEASSRHEFNCCFDGDEEARILTKAETPKLLRNLLSGVSVGILGVGVENEKAGSFARLLTGTLESLQDLMDQQRAQTKVLLSYGIYGISDSSCIDLLNYERKEVDQVAELMGNWTVLNEVEDVKAIVSAVEQGYSLPCVVVVRVFSKSLDSELPGAMSTLLLADLGSISSGSLEKSFAQLKSSIFTLDQPIIPQDGLEKSDNPGSYLGAFVDRCFGGDMLTLIVAEVPKTGNARPIHGLVQLLDAARRIKNHPTPLLESPELVELDALMEAHSRLEVEHRSVRRELKQLQKALKVTEMQKEALMNASSLSATNSDTQRWEFELEMARLNMEKLHVHDRIRQCEIDLVCMEQERLLLLAEMDNKQKQLASLEERLRGTLEEKEKIKEEFTVEISGLSNRLEDAQKKLSATEKEKNKLQSNLEGATAKISSLESNIAEKERAKKEIEGQLKQDSAFSAMQLEAKLAELGKLKAELDKARSCEASLSKKLAVLESSSDGYKTAVHETETKLMALKVENATLLAKLEILSTKPQSPEVSRTIRVMEDKWEQERKAMHSVMDDLRKLIEAKDPSRILLPIDSALLTGPASKRGKMALKQDGMPSAVAQDKKKVTIREDPLPSEAESSYGEENAISEASGKGRRGGRRESLLKPPTAPKSALKMSTESNPSLNVTSDVQPNARPNVKSNAKAVLDKVLPGGGVRGKKKAPIDQPPATARMPTDQAEKVETKARTVKLQQSKLKESRPKPASPAAISKLFGPIAKPAGSETAIKAPSTVAAMAVPMEPKEIEIPGTPPPQASASPVKVWKPSAFIPGVAKKPPMEANSTATNGSIFASLSFAAAGSTDDGLRKRIKLPDRPKPLAAPNNPAADRKQDSAALSAIMSSFNIPSKK